MKERFYYITTTLPYVNASPHIGFALEIIQADVIARFKRNKGYNVFFNTGTDEHGVKIYEKALKNKLDPQDYCDKYASKFRQLKQELYLSYDNFVRTTDIHHIKSAQEFWKRCETSGDIYKKKYKAKYCVGCEMMKTDSELVNGRCPFHPNRELKIMQEENYFFRFSNYQQKLLKFYKNHPNFVRPKEKYNEIIKFVENGLNDFSISRLKEKMPWGIDVPGDKKQVMYVWFDALISYISALGWPENKDNFENFWPGDQIAGKDNLRQQTAMWQAMLMSAGLPNSSQILIHGFITVNGEKMSKSLGNVVNPLELVKKYGVSSVRYFLLREFPSLRDGDFSYKKLEERYNSDLANGLGNLVNRVLTMAEKKFKNRFEPKSNSYFNDLFNTTSENIEKEMKEFHINNALSHIWELISECDRYIEREKIWEKKDKQSLENLLIALDKIALFLNPFLPKTSEKIFKQLGKDKKNKQIFEIKKTGPLFPRLKK